MEEKRKRIGAEAIYILTRGNLKVNKITEWIDNNKENLQEFKIVSCNSIPEEVLVDYSEVLEEIENDMPTEIPEPYYHVKPEDIRKEEKELQDDNEEVISYIISDENKRIAGICRIFRRINDNIKMIQWQFGVRKSYRRHGVARFLKALCYKDFFKNFPDLEEIQSDTHPSNKRMIKIMEEIGYKYSHTEEEYE